MGPTETSVSIALDDLRRIEDERQREIAAAKAAEEAASRAAAEEVRAREAHHARVAEAEARLRVEADERARREDADRRLEALRSELAAVRRDREALHRAVTTRAETATRRGAPRGHRAPLVLLATTSALSIALAAFAVFREPTVVTVVERPAIAAPLPVESPEVVEAAPAVAAVLEEPAPGAPERRRRGRGVRHGRPAAASPASTMGEADRLLRDIEACERGGGLLCGTE